MIYLLYNFLINWKVVWENTLKLNSNRKVFVLWNSSTLKLNSNRKVLVLINSKKLKELLTGKQNIILFFRFCNIELIWQRIALLIKYSWFKPHKQTLIK